VVKLHNPASDFEQAELDAPPAKQLGLQRVLFVVFLFSFVFDYKAPDIEFGATSTGGSPFQYAFLGLALLSGGLASLLGFRNLFVKPGVFLVILWWGYVAFMIVVSLLWGNEAGRLLRLLIPPLLVGLGINVTLIVAANGMRPGEAVRWCLVAAVSNVLWRFIFGAFFSGTPLSEIRMEILSPSIGFLFAWSGCALLLRKKFTWWTLLIFGLPLLVAAISITRSLILPLGVSFITAGFCLALAIVWKMSDLRFAVKKMVPLTAMGFAAIFILAGAMVAMPNMADRWYERFFDNRGQGGAETTEDLSTLMRKAEAVSMINILSEEPHSYIYGKGLGASYYWDESYYPELFQVYPNDRHQFPDEIYSAGHSIWTYTLFSSGVIGLLITLAAFFIPMGLSLHSARLISKTVMGPRAWDAFLMFLPFVAMWATLSESVTRNPFDERFTGVLLGFLIALPQFFYNRAFFLGYREAIGQEAPQIILDDDLLPDDYREEPSAPAAMHHQQGQGAQEMVPVSRPSDSSTPNF